MRGDDLAHVARAFDLVVNLAGLQTEHAREHGAKCAGPDAESVGELRVNDLAQCEVRGGFERARVGLAEHGGEKAHALGVVLRCAYAFVDGCEF